jgi:hypothetical protein
MNSLSSREMIQPCGRIKHDQHVWHLKLIALHQIVIENFLVHHGVFNDSKPFLTGSMFRQRCFAGLPVTILGNNNESRTPFLRAV